MKIRIGDMVLCRHVRPISPESIMEDLQYMFAHNGKSNPAAFPVTEFMVDAPEKACPDCGRVFRVGDIV